MKKIDIPFAVATGSIILVFVYAILSIKYACPPNYQPPNSGAQCYSENDVGWWHSSAVWTAIFTGILTLSSIFLWVANRRSAQIAERALTDLERPWIFITDSNADGIFNDPPFVLLKLCNFGRTVGEIRSMKGGVRRTASNEIEIGTIALPKVESSEVGNVVPPGGLPYAATLKFPPPVDENASAFIQAGEYRFVLRGEIHYTGLLKEPGVTAFCFLYDASKRQFARCGGEKYNYTK